MQQTLFGPSEPREAGKKQKISVARRRDDVEGAEPLQTLFGPVETRAQARRRAPRIVRLLGAIEDAPEAIKCCQHHIEKLEYFIQRSLRVQLDPNDRDGLQRLIGDTEEVLTQEDCDQMVSNLEVRRPFPAGWPGARRGDIYAAALHPKEIDYLRGMQDSLREDLIAIAAGAEDCKAELAALRAIGPLQEEIAERYALTPAGERSAVPARKRPYPDQDS